MFEYLDTKKQLLEEQRKNAELQARNTEVENALIELAGVVAGNEDAINNG